MSVVTAAFIDPYHPEIRAAITRRLPAGWRAVFAETPTPAERAGAAAAADVLFVLATPVPAGLLAEAPRLRLVQKLGIGVERIDRATCERRGIAIARLADGNAIPAAEHTVMLMLAALRRLPAMDRSVRAGRWLKEEARGVNRMLNGRRVGLIGFGAIGRRVAQALSGFAVEIVYHDPVAAPAEVEAALKARRVALDELLATADVVSLHLSLSAETAGLIDERRIGLMRRDAVLVNCARGGLVDEAALARALNEGRLFAAAVDTFAAEPPVGSPLLALERTVFTPHIAGATADNFERVLERAFDNARRYLAGGGLPPRDVVFVPADAAADS